MGLCPIKFLLGEILNSALPYYYPAGGPRVLPLGKPVTCTLEYVVSYISYPKQNKKLPM